ncbi:uncharacterized protein METZ01_LOCUS300546 [marine metagenome]|uniref:Uncharacterized protein n=1 Tax=marine metagenome TaxID=408172 RepID=A0A382MJW6_9ZZZZ
MSEEPRKEFTQEYLEEKLQAIGDKLGDAYGEPFLRELITRMERTVAHFNEEVDVMVETVKNRSKNRRKFLVTSRGDEFDESTDQEALFSTSGDVSSSTNDENKKSNKDSDVEASEPKKKRFSFFKRKKKD